MGTILNDEELEKKLKEYYKSQDDSDIIFDNLCEVNRWLVNLRDGEEDRLTIGEVLVKMKEMLDLMTKE